MFSYRSNSAKTSTHEANSTNNPRVMNLLQQMASSERQSMSQGATRVKDKRRINHSLSVSTSKREQFLSRPKFKHNTKEGEFINGQVKNIPYRFIPGYKNQTFIMPDRVFEQGKAGKRFWIKMKDSSIYSFREQEDAKTTSAIRKETKEKTILSRQNQEFNRTVDAGDGRKKAENNRWFLKARKIFQPTSAMDFFSQCEPLMQPKDPETKQIKKVSLAKTYDNRKKWRPVTRGSQPFKASMCNSFFQDEIYPASIA